MTSAPKSWLEQACAVPYRRSSVGLEICLVTSNAKGRWSLPKGIVEPHETPEQTALKETWEEAGLRGNLEGPPLGCYDDFKWDVELRVTGFLLHVTEILDDWPEAGGRRREWVSPAEANDRLRKSKASGILTAALARLNATVEASPPAE